MFTERYMVDWLLQNTLGPMWLAICAQHGWTPEAEANGTLAALASRHLRLDHGVLTAVGGPEAPALQGDLRDDLRDDDLATVPA